MNEYLIANVGNRDVLLDGGPIDEPLIKGKEILEQYEAYEARLSFPLFEKLVRNKSYEKIYLIVTDQKGELEDSYRKKDTRYFGEIIKKAHSTLAIDTFPLMGNPASYDNAFHSYAPFYETILQAHGDTDSLYYISLSGGTCAQNTASLYHGSIIFGENCQPVHVSEKESDIQYLKAASSIRRKVAVEHAKSSLGRYEYRSAYEQLKNESNDSLVLALLDYADFRSKFQFKKASTALGKGRKPKGMESLLFRRLTDECTRLEENDPAQLLLELSHLIRKYHHVGMFNEAFALLFRFVESALHYYVEKLTGAPLSSHDASDKNNKEKKILSYIQSNSSLHDFLDTKSINFESFPLSRMTLIAILEYFAKEKRMEEQAYIAIKKINDKANERNQGIFGHGTKTISGIDPALLSNMAFIVSDICTDTDTSFVYDEINKLVLGLLGC
ncbi:MAG: hypothetical protein PHW58_07190 [Candidatus Methanofastidiosa archaeon]|nr:hypothetical protein [Candidatus Methanofastidiosa archaeon]